MDSLGRGGCGNIYEIIHSSSGEEMPGLFNFNRINNSVFISVIQLPPPPSHPPPNPPGCGGEREGGREGGVRFLHPNRLIHVTD